MNINHSTVTYSSIVEIGEKISKLESETKDKYLKLHRGVMDVTHIDINSLCNEINYNDKKLQQYSPNNGSSELINTIKKELNLGESNVIITPGGMAALDLIINSLTDELVYIPNYHWGSWNKILKTHNKTINFFDDFNLQDFKPKNGIVMLCFPSNPTGFSPKFDVIKNFLIYSKENNITVILDLPYYYLFNENNDNISNYFYDNVIIASSFSKSIGLSGYRIGYISTKNIELFNSLKIRSLYKYNSISTVPQFIINELLIEKNIINKYKEETQAHIYKNIEFLKNNNLLFEHYTDVPVGPFAIVNLKFDVLLENKISSVPLSKFTLIKDGSNYNYSRISVSVNHDLFLEYFIPLLKNIK